MITSSPRWRYPGLYRDATRPVGLLRGKAAVGVSMWMRGLLPQVLGLWAGAFPGYGVEFAGAAISRLSNAGAAAALDMLDIAMAPGGARRSKPFAPAGPSCWPGQPLRALTGHWEMVVALQCLILDPSAGCGDALIAA